MHGYGRRARLANVHNISGQNQKENAEMVDALAHTTEGREMEMDSSRRGVLTLAHTTEGREMEIDSSRWGVLTLAHTAEGREMEMDSSRWGVLTLAHTAEFVTAVAVQASIAHVRSSGARRGFVEKLLDFFFRYGELEV